VAGKRCHESLGVEPNCQSQGTVEVKPKQTGRNQLAQQQLEPEKEIEHSLSQRSKGTPIPPFGTSNVYSETYSTSDIVTPFPHPSAANP
jgi:hypothetical protein